MAKGILQHNDIHYLVGFLYVASGRTDIKVTLGVPILDDAAEEKRDVDIVILSVKDHVLMGIEVKDETRPLDVIKVESLCQKLNDMPSLGLKAIVSSSNYTGPARKKAAAHGVRCLTLVRGTIPKFDAIDFTQLKNMTVNSSRWTGSPHVVWDLRGYGPLPTIIPADAKVSYPNGPEELKGREATARDLVENVLGQTARLLRPQVSVQSQYVEGQNKPLLHIKGMTYEIRGHQITGNLEHTEKIIPLSETCYLADEDNKPFASVVLFDVDGTLHGLASTTCDRRATIIILPPELRNCRPIRKDL